MPGGLSRIAGSDGDVVSGQRGGSSKDTWVLSDSPVERVTLLPGRLGPDDVAQRQRVVSSRAAEHLFWLGRYAERSENCARLLRSCSRGCPTATALPLAWQCPRFASRVPRACWARTPGWRRPTSAGP